MRRAMLTARNRFSKFKVLIAILLILGFLYILKSNSSESNAHGWDAQDTARSMADNVHEGDRQDFSRLLVERRISFLDSDEHVARRRTVLEGCQKTDNSDWLASWPRMKLIPTFPNDPLLSTKTNLFYCPVGKVASTFLTRWMLTMEKSGPMTSPFTVPIQNAKRELLDSLTQIKSPATQIRFLESSVKVVFGRDPFARVFSAYIEKMFRPNFFYWRKWGVKALKASNAKIEHCGSRVNFQQFVQFAMTPEALLDKHMRPVSLECQMCQMYYNVIGKVESIVPDLEYISEKINVSSQFQREKNYSYDSRKDALKEVLYRVFQVKDLLKKCISMDEMGKRIWRELEIRGLKDVSVEYPFKAGEMDNMTESELLSACKAAMWVSTDKAKLKRQKKQAVDELYLTLTSSDVDLILTAFAKDFDLFGYSTKPSYLFDASYRAGIKTTNIMDWNAPWQLP